jgi:hypothetical protein
VPPWNVRIQPKLGSNAKTIAKEQHRELDWPSVEEGVLGNEVQ